MKVKLVMVPGGVSTREITVEDATLADVVALLSLGDKEVRVNGEKVAADTAISDGDMISAAAPIKGA